MHYYRATRSESLGPRVSVVETRYPYLSAAMPVPSPVPMEISVESLEPRRDLVDYSAPDLDWYGGGGGAAQLSLALLADALHDDDRAAQHHEWFKWAVVGNLPRNGWTLTDHTLRLLITLVEKNAAGFRSARTWCEIAQALLIRDPRLGAEVTR